MLGAKCSPCCCIDVGVAMRSFSGPLRLWNYCGSRLPCATNRLHNLTKSWQFISPEFNNVVPLTNVHPPFIRVDSSRFCFATLSARIAEDDSAVEFTCVLAQAPRIAGFAVSTSAVVKYRKPIDDYKTELRQKRITIASSDAHSIDVLDGEFEGAVIANAAEIVLIVDPVKFDYANAEYEITVTGDVVVDDAAPAMQAGKVFADAVYGIAHEFSFTNPIQNITDAQVINGLAGGGCATGLIVLEVPLNTNYGGFPHLTGFFGLRFNLPARNTFFDTCTAVGPIGMMQGQQFFVPEICFVAFHTDCECQLEHLFFDNESFVFLNAVAVETGEFAVNIKMSPKTDATEAMPVICGNPLP